MCNQCIESFTNSHYISKDKPVSLFNRFPCGYCSDCIRKKRSEWQLRAYYEAKQCFDNGGFVLFDTLTYKDSDLRYFPFCDESLVSGWYNWRESWNYAFSRDDVRKFFKKLRRRLEFQGYDVDNNLRFLLSSEYGTSEITKGVRNTHRPHYHILFYVNFPIKPLKFSQLVAQCWTHGKTDGVRPYKTCSRCPVKDYCKNKCIYHSSLYVLNERLLTFNNPNCLKLSRYVSKYIGKDLYLYRKLYSKVFRYFDKKYSGQDWQNDYNKRLEFNRLKRQVLPFHTQSIGFGLSALKYEDSSYINEQQAIRMPISDKGVVASIPLSHYYRYKLYFDHFKVENKVVFRPKSKYYQIKLNRLNRQIIDLRNELFLYDNTLTLAKCTDIAKYSLVYRGVLCPREDFNLPFEHFYLKRLKVKTIPEYLTSGRCWINYNSFRNRLGNNVYISDSFENDNYPNYLVNFDDIQNSWSPGDFVKLLPYDWIFLSQDIPLFNGFDDILDSFFEYKRSIGLYEDKKQSEKDELNDKYKSAGML